MLTYLFSTYIGISGNPLFPIEQWNQHHAAMNSLGRTNNAQEGYHRALRDQFNAPHPKLSK
jgi:hypothetical protein